MVQLLWKHVFSIRSSHYTARQLHKTNESIYPHKLFLKEFCDSFVDWLNTSTIFRFVEHFSCFVRGTQFVFSNHRRTRKI